MWTDRDELQRFDRGIAQARSPEIFEMFRS
jgi:hypothetical protein